MHPARASCFCCWRGWRGGMPRQCAVDSPRGEIGSKLSYYLIGAPMPPCGNTRYTYFLCAHLEQWQSEGPRIDRSPAVVSAVWWTKNQAESPANRFRRHRFHLRQTASEHPK